MRNPCLLIEGHFTVSAPVRIRRKPKYNSGVAVHVNLYELLGISESISTQVALEHSDLLVVYDKKGSEENGLFLRR